jgi:hypothetical protein
MICLYAPSIFDIETEEEAGCPNGENRNLPIPIVDNNVDPDVFCAVSRVLC